MPFYDYKCRNTECGKIQEELHSISECTDEKCNNLKCAVCGKEGMDRMIGGGGLLEYSIMSVEERKQSLKKRSHDHFKKELSDKFHHLNRKGFMP